MKKKISILVNGTFHALELARFLYDRNQLGLLIICYPKFKIFNKIFDNQKIKTFGLIYLLQIILSKIDPYKKNILNYWIINIFDFLSSILINKNNTDILICWASISSITIKKCKKLGIKTVVIRGSTHIDYQIKLLKKEYIKFQEYFYEHNPLLIKKEKREYDLSDCIEVPSQLCKKTFIQNHFDEKKISVIPTGIDHNFFHCNKIRDTKPSNIIFVGNTIYRKGLTYLIDSLNGINFNFTLTIVGSINKEKLFAHKKDISKSKIIFKGHLNQKALLHEYSKADIFCLPSLEEGMATVILQAMSCSLPVIVTNVSGGEDIIQHDLDGIIIDPANSNQISENLNKLYYDDNLRNLISSNARKKIINKFQKKIIFEKALNSYLNL